MQFRALCKDLSAVYLTTAANGLLGIVAVPVGVHYLGGAGYGVSSIYGLLVSFIYAADLGMGKNLLRLLSAQPEDAGRIRYLQTALSLYIVLAAVWAACLPVAVTVVRSYLFPVPEPFQRTLVVLIVCSIAEFIIGIPQSLTQTVYVAQAKFVAYSKYSVAAGILKNVAFILACLSGSVAVVGVCMVARKVPEFLIARRLLGPLPPAAWRPSLTQRDCRTMLGRSGELFLGQILSAMLPAAASYLTNAFFGLQVLGYYRAAFDLAAKVSVVANGISLVSFPRLAAALSDRRATDRALPLAAPLLALSWATYNALATLGVVLGPIALPRIGLRTPMAVELFTLLIVGLSLNCHVVGVNDVIQASGRYRFTMIVNGVGLAVLFGAFLASVRTAGILAAGIAWIVSTVVSAGLGDWSLLRVLGSERSVQWASAGIKAFVLLGSATMLGRHLASPTVTTAIGAACVSMLVVIFAALAVRRAYSGLRAGQTADLVEAL